MNLSDFILISRSELSHLALHNYSTHFSFIVNLLFSLSRSHYPSLTPPPPRPLAHPAPAAPLYSLVELLPLGTIIMCVNSAYTLIIPWCWHDCIQVVEIVNNFLLINAENSCLKQQRQIVALNQQLDLILADANI